MKRDVNRAFGRRFNGWYGRVLRCTSKLLALRHQLQVLQRSHEVCVCESGPLALGLVVTVQRLANGTRHREAALGTARSLVSKRVFQDRAQVAIVR